MRNLAADNNLFSGLRVKTSDLSIHYTVSRITSHKCLLWWYFSGNSRTNKIEIDEFVCRNELEGEMVISPNTVCDGIEDCAEGSDEKGCELIRTGK